MRTHKEERSTEFPPLSPLDLSQIRLSPLYAVSSIPEHAQTPQQQPYFQILKPTVNKGSNDSINDVKLNDMLLPIILSPLKISSASNSNVFARNVYYSPAAAMMNPVSPSITPFTPLTINPMLPQCTNIIVGTGNEMNSDPNTIAPKNPKLRISLSQISTVSAGDQGRNMSMRSTSCTTPLSIMNLSVSAASRATVWVKKMSKQRFRYSFSINHALMFVCSHLTAKFAQH